MARTRTAQPKPPNGFIASAVRLPAASSADAGKQQGWQGAAWKYFDSVGELRYLSNWIGNVLSRASLHAAKRTGNELSPLDAGPAREAMDALYGGHQQQSEMLHLLGVGTTVSGEGYITARTVDGQDSWDVLSTGNVTQSKGGKINLNFGDGEGRYEKKNDDLVIRVWTPHPTNPRQADAPTRSNLQTLGQIVGYDDHISAQLTSRLAGAGLLMMPSEIEFAAPPESDPEASQADSLMQSMYEAMNAAMQDRNSPSAFVPIVVTAPGEHIDAVKHLTFWSDLDNAVIEMRQSAIQRFAIGMDVPPEVLMGNGDANHWNAWLSEESAIKAHLEPRLAVVASALTTQYLRPALTGVVSEEELTDYFVIADTSEIRIRPNRSDTAIELWDRGLANSASVRREAGFKPEDAPSNDEYVTWLLQRISLGAVTPELTVEALRILGANIDTSLTIGDTTQNQPTHTKSDTEVDPVRALPEPDPLSAACEVMVFRALERAGNKLRNKHPRTDTSAMPADEVYMRLSSDVDDLMAGAWDCAPKVLDGLVTDHKEIVGMLDFYVRGLLSQKRAHSRTTMEHLIAAAV